MENRYGHVSVIIEQSSFNYKFAEIIQINEEESNIILELDDDLTTSILILY